MPGKSPDFANPPGSATRPCFRYAPAGTTSAPAVTVVTPFFNAGPEFDQTLASVHGQSLQQWEWIIVNDASSDPRSVDLLHQHRESDPRIRVIDLEQNRGPSAARNVGIEHATAELVFFLDSDDLMEPTTLEKLTWHLAAHPGCAFCNGLTVGFGEQQHLVNVGFDSRDLFLDRNPVSLQVMMRRAVLQEVGGFDESLVHGMEDWDLWLRCASHGHWGNTIPEPMGWYRRRRDHSDRWRDWTGSGLRAMRRELKKRYPLLFRRGISPARLMLKQSLAPLEESLPVDNPLAKNGRHLLLIVPWMTMGGADKFNLDLMAQLHQRGYRVSVVTTVPGRYDWEYAFAALTPDLFVLPRFLPTVDYPRFLHYLIQSRQSDVVLISNSELGYKLLPYLRPRCPETAFVDYNHMEEEHWNSGGHPRTSVGVQSLLDRSMVTSHHLKRWMVAGGAQPDPIEVCYVSVDTAEFSPNADLREQVRAELSVRDRVPLLLYAGRICEQKQPQVFARVMLELKDRGIKYRCLVAGDGEDLGWLQRFLRRHRLRDRIWTLGPVTSGRMKELLAASDVVFLPSQMEGISVVFFEAMSMGVVPVGADVGGQRELITPDCGVLVQRAAPEIEVQAYADALVALLQEPDRLRKMGQACRERACEAFSLDLMGEQAVSVLEAAIRDRRRGPDFSFPANLGSEWTLQAIEYERLFASVQHLWKYRRIEEGLQRALKLLAPWYGRLGHLLWVTGRPLRKVKDAVWIQGRKIKDLVWVAAHKIKVRLLGLPTEE